MDASPKQNGWIAAEVKFGNSQKQLGVYRQIAGKHWQDTLQINGTKFDFKEFARDEWSVYLKDDSRQSTGAVRLTHQEDLLPRPTNTRRELYQILPKNSL